MLAEKFGPFVVRIKDPTTLLGRIRAVWAEHPWAFEGSAVIAPVIYNKDGVLNPDPYLIAPPEYCYAQKPGSFEEEREFRYVLKCSIPARQLTDHLGGLTLPFPDCNDILELEDHR
jgi:hypothetical protein